MFDRGIFGHARDRRHVGAARSASEQEEADQRPHWSSWSPIFTMSVTGSRVCAFLSMGAFMMTPRRKNEMLTSETLLKIEGTW